jgi:type III secretion protein R
MQPNDLTGILIVIVAISVLPFVAMVVTSYTKIVVVLGLVRNALGVQQVPPNMVLNGIAIIVSCYVLTPVGIAAAQNLRGAPQSTQGSVAVMQAMDAAREPFRQFLLKHAHEREKAFFLRSAKALWPKDIYSAVKGDDLVILAPSFTLTELNDAFRIGFLLYVSFIAIDIIIANVLMAMGLNQVNPTNVAIPFKLLLFVAADGWSTLIHGLVLTYR